MPWTILWSKAHLLMPAKGGKRRKGNLVQYQRALEALEYRVVLSTATTDAAVGSGPSVQDFGPISLIDVPVSADLRVSQTAEALFGDPPFSMIVPLPQFLTPAGTSTVTTSWLGPITFTNFQIDSEQLNQFASNITLPNVDSPSISPYVQAITIQTSSTFNLISFILEPIALDLLGINVVMSGVDMTMGFEDGPGNPSLTGDVASAISIVSRALDMFASGVGLVARKAQEIADKFALPAGLSSLLEGFAPPAATIPITRYQVPPTASESSTFTVSIARGAVVDVSATTGPSKLLGNLVAEALYLENRGYENLKALVARFLSELLPRMSVEAQRDVLFNVPFERMVPERSVNYQANYQAQVGSFVSSEPSSSAAVVVYVKANAYAAPGQAGAQASVVGQSGAALIPTGRQRPPGGPVVGPQSDSPGPALTDGGTTSQGRNDSGSGQQQPTQSKKKDDTNYLLFIFPSLNPLYQSKFGNGWFFGFGGASQGAFGGARIQLKKNDKLEYKEEKKPARGDDHPLPRVLPDLGLDDDDRDPPRTPPAGDSGEAGVRGASASWSGPWGQGFSLGILLLTSSSPGMNYSITFTGEEELSDDDALRARPGDSLRRVHDLRARFRAKRGSHRWAWRRVVRPWPWK